MPIFSVVKWIEEKIGIDYDRVKEYIKEMETNISLMRGMVKHLFLLHCLLFCYEILWC